MDSNYKILQVASFFMTKYNYRRLMINGLVSEDEYYICSKDNPYYQLIRVSFDRIDDISKREQCEDLCHVVAKTMHISNLQFLDIRVSNETVNESIKEGLVCIEENHYSGEDLKLIYPGIEHCVYYVADPEQEKSRLEKNINKAFLQRARKELFRLNRKTVVSYVFIVLCIANFIVKSILVSKGYSKVPVEVFLGSDYKTFTLGIGQYWRLLTCAFVHGSVTHLLCNTYSLFMIGRYLEEKYGSLKYLVIILGSIISGSLTFGLLNTNGNICGLSGGLYGLLAVYVLEIVFSRKIINRSIFYILFLNVLMNFLPNVGWQAHLGGFVFGAVCYFMFKDGKLDKSYIIVACIVMLVLGFKYVQNNDINPMYIGTDLEVVEIENDILGERASQNTIEKLNKLYLKEGVYE